MLFNNLDLETLSKSSEPGLKINKVSNYLS